MHYTNYRIVILIIALGLFFWWPLSHLFYSDWYHTLLGFEPGSYQPSMVLVIGSCGFLPVMNLIVIAFKPDESHLLIYVMIIFALIMAFMYIYLIAIGLFPVLEWFNVGLSLTLALFLLIVKPQKKDA